jgi:hypothetical protein
MRMDAQNNNKKRLAFAALGLALVASPMAATLSPAYARSAMADPAFEQVWDRTDKPVEERMAARSWTWGPEPFYTAYEPYTEGPGGQHLVTYFDKSRMEINNPAGDRNAQWYVTNGLLVVDMVSGRIQTGNNSFTPAPAATIPVAGDASSVNAPTYAALARVSSLKGDNRAPNRVGQNVREGLGRDGNVGIVDSLAGFAKYGVYESTLGHNIPDVFWSFLNQRGTVYKDGRYAEDTIVDWLFAMGYPISEPYWISIKVGNEDRWVLMQAFQRRILTYSPYNPDGWKVEMANVGRAYFDWRYKQVGQATPAPVVVASISISPASGENGTQITVSGKNFPAHAAVNIAVEKPEANYSRGIATVAAGADGSFSAKITLPADAADLGKVNITATANGGSIKAFQTFTATKVSYDPAITVSPADFVVVNGTVRVKGTGFPAGLGVRIGLYSTDGKMDWLTSAKADSNGNFDVNMAIGNRPVGKQYTVVATGDKGTKATSRGKLTVINQPTVQVTPANGPAGVNVTFKGTKWLPNSQVVLGLRAANKTTEAWLPNPVATDAAGNFSVTMFIDNSYAGAGEVRLIASEARSGVRVEGAYRITSQPPAPAPSPTPTGRIVPSGLPMTVSSYSLDNAPATYRVRGEGFKAGQSVAVSVFSLDGGVNAVVASAVVGADGKFQASFESTGARWWGRPDLGVRAITADGKQSSVRYLPLTSMVKTDSRTNTYTIRGFNYPSNVQVHAVLKIAGESEKVIGTATVAPNGTVVFNASLPRIPDENRNDVEIRIPNQPYLVTMDF